MESQLEKLLRISACQLAHAMHEACASKVCDNAPAHTLLSVRRFLNKKNTVLSVSHYIHRTWFPCDFLLFSKLKRATKRKRSLATIKEIKAGEHVRSASRIGKNPWLKCVISSGDYFEEDKRDIDE